MFKALTIAALFTMSAHAAAADPAASSITLGGGVALVPEYAGAQRIRLRPLIDVDYQSGTGFFSGSRGVGYQSSGDAVNFRAALTYDPGRKDHQSDAAPGSDDLKGMGNIKGAAVGVMGMSVDAGLARFSADAHVTLSDRQRGNTYVLGLSRPLFAGAGDQVALAVSATYADKKSAQSYFGVTTTQAAASGYRAYTAAAGVQDANIALNWHHVIDPRWSVRSLVAVSTLLGDAGKSPIVRRRSHAMLATTLNYAF